jgi:hypothetical protein
MIKNEIPKLNTIHRYVLHLYNPSTPEAEQGGCKFKASLGPLGKNIKINITIQHKKTKIRQSEEKNKQTRTTKTALKRSRKLGGK